MKVINKKKKLHNAGIKLHTIAIIESGGPTKVKF